MSLMYIHLKTWMDKGTFTKLETLDSIEEFTNSLMCTSKIRKELTQLKAEIEAIL